VLNCQKEKAINNYNCLASA